eukprot:m.148947 g.148947  ORF g.148947 m.148947 type:complete len:2177 (+) comp15063_c6_seq1:1159-7689(+)
MAGRTLMNGDFISLFTEGQGVSGYVSQESFSESWLSIYPQINANAPAPGNFQQSCVFQIFVAHEDTQPGEAITFGHRVVLMHRASQKFLTKSKISSENGFQAQLETITPLPAYVRTAAAVELVDDDDTGNDSKGAGNFPLTAMFTIIPRFKISADGDAVRLNDQVLFVSCDGTTSTRWYLGAQYQDRVWLLCLGNARTTGLRPRLFAPYGVSSEAFRQTLKGGDFVRLFHKENNGYLTIAPLGTQAANTDTSSALTVHLRALEAEEDPEAIHDPSSVWQVEMDNASQAGGRPVQWADHVRLKNLLTGCYLDVTLQLSSERADNSLLFFVDATSSEEAPASTAIPYDALMYITGSNTWLHVQSPHAHEAEQGREAEHTMLAQFSPNKKDESAFELHPVSLTDIREFFFADAQLKHLQVLKSKQHQYDTIAAAPHDLKEVTRALRELIYFCTDDDEGLPVHEHDGDPYVSHQIILLDLKIDELLMPFVTSLFDTSQECSEWASGVQVSDVAQYTEFHELGRTIMRLFRQMCKENKRVGLHFSKHRTVLTHMCLLLSHVPGVTWDIASTIEMMFSNNHELLSEVDQPYVAMWLNMILNCTMLEDVHEYFALLASFCQDDNEPVKEAQNAIRHVLLHADLVLPRFSVHQGRLMVTARAEPARSAAGGTFGTWARVTLPVQDYLDAAHSNLEYITSALNLLAEVCEGRNTEAQQELRAKYMDVHTMLDALTDESLPALVKASFCKLMGSAFIVCDPLEDLVALHSRSWDMLNDTRALHAARTHLAAALGEHAHARLLDWIEGYFGRHRGSLLQLRAERALKEKTTTKHGRPAHLPREQLQRLQHDIRAENHGNTLTWRMLDLIDVMVQLGLYHGESGATRRSVLQRALLLLLRDTAGRHGHAAHESSAHKIIFRAQRKICEILLKLLTFATKAKLVDLLLQFRAQYDRKMRDKGGKHKHLGTHPEPELAALFANEPQNKAIFQWYTPHGVTDEEFAEIIFDLCSHHHDKLRLSAIKLLVRSFSVRADLLQMVKDVRIVADYSEDIFRDQSHEALAALQHLVDESEHAFHPDKMVTLLDSLARRCISDVHHTKTEELIKSAASRAARGAPVGPLEATRMSLRLRDGVAVNLLPVCLDWHSALAEVRMARTHQEILGELDAHTRVLAILHHHLHHDDHHVEETLRSSPPTRALLQACFRFLRLWCHHDIRNKNLLVKEKFSFLSHCCRFGIGAAETLYQVLKDNPGAYDRSHIGDPLLHRHVDNFLSHPHCRDASYLHLFGALVTRKHHTDLAKAQLVLGRLLDDKNVHLLYKMHIEADLHAPVEGAVTHFVLGQDYSQGAFIEPMMAMFDGRPGVHADLLQLDYYLSLVRLLCVCAESEDPATRERVKRFIPLSSVLPVFTTSHNVPLDVRSVFMKLLLETFFLPVHKALRIDAAPTRLDERALGQHAAVLRSLGTDCRRLLLQVGTSEHDTKTIIDPYLFKRIVPLMFAVLHSASRDFVVLQDECLTATEQFTQTARQALADLLALLQSRKDIDINRFYMDTKGHETAAKSLLALQRMEENDADAALISLLLETSALKAFTELHDYFDNKEMKLAIKKELSSKHTHHGGHKSHASHTAHGTHARHGTHIGHGTHTGHHGTHTGGEGGVDHHVHVVTDTEAIMDEKLNFAAQLQQVLKHGLPDHARIRWLQHLATDIDFPEFWILVSFFKRHILALARQAAHPSKPNEASKDQNNGPALAPAPAPAAAAAAARPGSTVAVAPLVFASTDLEMKDLPHAHGHGQAHGAEHPHSPAEPRQAFHIEHGLRGVMTHFKHTEERGGSLDEDGAAVLSEFLDVLSCVLAREACRGTRAEIETELHALSLALTNLGLPLLTLQLTATSSAATASRALQTTVLLLLASPAEAEHVAHSQAQLVLYKYAHESAGRRAVRAMVSRIDELATELLAEDDTGETGEDEDQEMTLEERISEQALGTHVVVLQLSLLRFAVDDCYQDMQTLLRGQEMLPALMKLSASLAEHFESMQDVILYDCTQHDTIFEIQRNLTAMRDNTRVLLELTRLLAGLTAGPNRENQNQLVFGEVCKPLLSCLAFMENRGTNRGTIDLFREDVANHVEDWRVFFQVKDRRHHHHHHHHQHHHHHDHHNNNEDNSIPQQSPSPHHYHHPHHHHYHLHAAKHACSRAGVN